MAALSAARLYRTTLPLRLGRFCATDVLYQYQRTSFSSPRANFSLLSFFLTQALFCPSFRIHALKTVLNLPHSLIDPSSRFTNSHCRPLLQGANSCRMNVGHHSHCTHVWCIYHANVYPCQLASLSQPYRRVVRKVLQLPMHLPNI